MSLRAEHDLHQRRKGRNIGVGLLLAGFIALVFVLTFVKITRGDFEMPRDPAAGGGAGAEASE